MKNFDNMKHLYLESEDKLEQVIQSQKQVVDRYLFFLGSYLIVQKDFIKFSLENCYQSL